MTTSLKFRRVHRITNLHHAEINVGPHRIPAAGFMEFETFEDIGFSQAQIDRSVSARLIRYEAPQKVEFDLPNPGVGSGEGSSLPHRVIIDQTHQGFVDQDDSSNDELPSIIKFNRSELMEILGGEDEFFSRGNSLASATIRGNLAFEIQQEMNSPLHINVEVLIIKNTAGEGWRAMVYDGAWGYGSGPVFLPMSDSRSSTSAPLIDFVLFDINEGGLDIQAVLPQYASYRPLEWRVTGYLDVVAQPYFAA